MLSTLGCFDSDAQKACEISNGTSSGALYLFNTCYNATVVALNESMDALDGDTILNKYQSLPESEKVPAAQEFFK